MIDYEFGWEKFRFPDEIDEDEGEDIEYKDGQENIVMSVVQGIPNPFFQPKSFNFWILHTNFKITKNIAYVLNDVLGIESMEVISPYRIILSVGQKFDEEIVKSAAQKAVLTHLTKNEKTRKPKRSNSTNS